MTTKQSAKEIVEEALITFFNKRQCDEATVRRYLDDNYVQYIDYGIIDFHDILRNLGTRLEKYQSSHISFIELFSQNNKVCSIHVLEAESKDGKKVIAQGQAVFYLKKGKIEKCIELTRVIHDPEHDLLLKNHI